MAQKPQVSFLKKPSESQTTDIGSHTGHKYCENGGCRLVWYRRNIGPVQAVKYGAAGNNAL